LSVHAAPFLEVRDTQDVCKLAGPFKASSSAVRQGRNKGIKASRPVARDPVKESVRMKPLMTAAMVMALAAGAAAAHADPQDWNQQGGDHHGQGQGQGGRGGGDAGRGQGHYQGGQNFNGPRRQFEGGAYNRGQNFQGGGQADQAPRFQRYRQPPQFQQRPPQFQRPERFQGGPVYERQYHGRYNGQGRFQGGVQNWNGEQGERGFAGVPGADRALRGRDQGRAWFSPNRFPRQFHAERRFYDRDDFYPRGWYYRTWFYGDYLPWGWYGPAYYLDYWSYELPPPPIGCEWIREGHDAVLVDVWTGEVLSVAYNVFW
jgi:Ni/Co efflux regulator RcnB